MSNCDFSYKHYEETLLTFKNNYSFSNFYNHSNNDIILRHDIDYSLESALAIAEIEHRIGVSSTFFLLFHSEMYNIFSPTSVSIISRILELGHYIGLHYDSTVLLSLNANPGKILREELAILEEHFGTKTNVVSAHNPTLNDGIEIPQNIINAYDPEFTQDRKYLSDSVQFWRENCFCTHVNKHKKLQILTHPIWWSEKNTGRNYIMDELVGGSLDPHMRHIEKYSSVYDSYIEKESTKRDNFQTQ